MQTILESQKFTIVKLQNSITAANAYQIERKITTVLRENSHLNILVDLRQVEFMDSSGLMALMSSCKLAQSLQKRFSLCSVSNSLKIIIELTQLDNVFEIFESEAKYRETL
ncbi:anti-anti-sigma factor [Rivularia sp. PCC 7116]|uniref:STAS domain-containing protein n=1 Tax=Rivularia sp. PCC 7116 TaxID=373994 RepID=UPI00029EFB3B|nr:STAS domain-containing protein [Rivularia sp. PCC 7116]AFY58144.1 anti-anti-sigma factor [Rivularia sp. PCC 7116]